MTTRDESIAAYKRLLTTHDWSYAMADDYSVYRRGASERAALEAARALYDKDYTIWNQLCPRSQQMPLKPRLARDL